MIGISSISVRRIAKYKKRRRLQNGGMITWPVALAATEEFTREEDMNGIEEPKTESEAPQSSKWTYKKGKRH